MNSTSLKDQAQAEAVIRYYKASHKSFVRVWAGKYDQSLHFGYYDAQHSTHAAAMLRMNEVIADLAAIGPDDVVIDAGCGFGGSTVWLAEKRAKHVFGINIVPHQIEIAEALARDRNVADRTDFLRCDYADIPLEPRSANIFWAIESMVHATDRAAVLAEAYRLLRPGGRMVIVEYFLRTDPPIDPSEIRSFDTILSGWAMPSLTTLPGLCAMAEQAGFSDATPIDMNDNVAPSLQRIRRIAGASLFVTRPLAALGLYDPDRVAHAVATVRLAEAILAGQIRYAAVVAHKPGTDDQTSPQT